MTRWTTIDVHDASDNGDDEGHVKQENIGSMFEIMMVIMIVYHM